jgi:hypothetical protein
MNVEDDAFLIFKPGRYYCALWCAKLKSIAEYKGGDLLALLWREENQPHNWHFDYRFRWYWDDRVWGSKDKKSGYKMIFTASEQKALEQLQLMFVELGLAGATELNPYWIKGNSDHAMDLFAKNPPPWMHQQRMLQA